MRPGLFLPLGDFEIILAQNHRDVHTPAGPSRRITFSGSTPNCWASASTVYCLSA